MKLIEKLKGNLMVLNGAVRRFSLAIIFLIGSVIVNGIAIESIDNLIYSKLLATFLVGAFLAASVQMAYERFLKGRISRWVLYLLVILASALYFLSISSASDFNLIILVRTALIMAVLLVAFIWIPSIRKELSFNETFIVAFKAFFVSIFYGLVMFLGISLILGATDILLFQVYEPLYGHVAGIVFILFFPMNFLSMIPRYHEDDKGKIIAAASIPRFLEILLSYIIIPLISVFTVILLIYIVINLGGRFWSENLLEPMLVAYSIVVIIVSILSMNLTNRFTETFKKIFPKVLIPLVLFQVIASVLKIGDMGLTHGRYYVILYGVFAVVAGVVFSFFNKSKTGVIALVFIVFSTLSIIPPVDAFTVSRINQESTLEKVLLRNDMLVDDRIVPKENIKEQDKIIITNTANYLWRMEYSKGISWLGAGFDYYSNFEKVFGFETFESYVSEDVYYDYNRKANEAFSIEGYDFMTKMMIYVNENDKSFNESHVASFKGVEYTLEFDIDGKDYSLYVKDGSDKEIIVFDVGRIIDELKDEGSSERFLSTEDSTFLMENDEAAIKIIVNHLDSYKDSRSEAFSNFNGEFFVLVDIK